MSEFKGIKLPDGQVYTPLGGGGSGELRLVKRIILEEETNSVFFDKDDNDFPFELEEFRIYILAKATSTNETDGHGLICINTKPISYTNYLINRIEGLFAKQYDKLMWIHSIFLDNKWQTNHGIRTYVNAGNINMQTSLMTFDGTFAKKAYSFTIGDASAGADWYFGIGTEIVVYGR